jgi:WD40 repeat protein
VPKVIDFGIAKATEGRLTDATVYTQLHQFIGTPAYLPQSGEEDLRGVEWRYSWGQLRGDEVGSWKVGNGLITWLRCTPDGRYVLSAPVGKKLKVYDSETGRIVAEIDFVNRSFFGFQMSDDGRFLACLSDDGLSVFSAPDWKLVFHIAGYGNVAFSPDGHLLAFQIEQSIRVFDTTTWQPSPSDIPTGADSMVFRADGKSLLVAGQGRWRVFSVPTGEEVHNLIPPVEPADQFILDRTRRFLFSWTGESLKLRRADTLELLWTSTNIHTAAIQGATFSRDGQMLATASLDQTIALWRMKDGALIGRLRGHQNEVWALDASADGKFLLSAGKDGMIKKWQWSAPMVRTRMLGSDEIIAYPLGGKDHLVTIDPNVGSLNAWSESGPTSWPIQSNVLSQVPRNKWASGVYLDESKNLVFMTATNTLVFIPTTGGLIERHIQLGQGTFVGCSLSPNKRWLCLVCQADSGRFGCQRIQIWDLANGRLVRELPGVTGFAWAYSQQAAFSGNSSFLAFPDGNHEIVVWNLQKDKEERRLRGSSWHVNQVCFSNGGEALAAAGWDGMVYLWDLTSGQLKTEPMQGHGSGVIAVGFSKDDRTLVSSGDDDTVRFWSTANGLEMLRLNDRVSPQSLWDGDSLLFSKQSRLRENTACLIEKIPSFSEIQAAEIRAPLLSAP